MKFRITLLLLAVPALLCAQAMVETGLAAGAAAGASSGVAKAGKAIAGTMENLTKTLSGAGDAKSGTITETVRFTTPSKTTEVKPEVSYEDSNLIRQGMSYTELVHRFGPPSLQLTGSDGGLIMSYVRKGSGLDVTVRNGRVAEVRRADGAR